MGATEPLAMTLATAASHALDMDPSEAINVLDAFYVRLRQELKDAEADKYAAAARRGRLAS